MKRSTVFISERVEKILKHLPRSMNVLFWNWVNVIEKDGYYEMRKVIGYRDHALVGKLKHYRSTSLNRSYRIIYLLIETEEIIVEVIEVNKHDYKI